MNPFKPFLNYLQKKPDPEKQALRAELTQLQNRHHQLHDEMTALRREIDRRLPTLPEGTPATIKLRPEDCVKHDWIQRGTHGHEGKAYVICRYCEVVKSSPHHKALLEGKPYEGA